MNLLIVENDVPHMRLMAWALRQEGFTVDAVPLADAIQRVRDLNPAVVVFNTSEPDAEKAACIQSMRQAHAGVRIIDLAPDAESPDHITGADAYMNMPVAAADLKATIERLASTKA